MGAAVPRAVMVARVKGGNTDECLAECLAPRRSLSSFLPSGPQGLHEKGSLQHLPLLVICPHTGGWEARESPSVHAAGGDSSGERGQGGVWAQNSVAAGTQYSWPGSLPTNFARCNLASARGSKAVM